MKRIDVILIESSHLIREGFKKITENVADINVVFSADRLSAAEMHLYKADVIILNPRMVAGENLQQVLHGIRKANDSAAIIAMHTHYEPSNVLKHFDNIIELDCESSVILEKIRSTQQTTDSIHQESCELSAREKEVLVAVAQGLTNKEIADRLNISIHTVIAHRKNVTGKTGIKTISGLTLYAMTNGLL